MNTEIKSIRESFKIEMFNYIVEEFKKRGFVADPRNGYIWGLYNPELKISIHVGSITKVSFGISIYDMVNDGMTWGNGYKKLSNGTEIRFYHLKKDFEKFYNTTFKNRVKKLNLLSEV